MKLFKKPITIGMNVFLMTFSLASVVLLLTSIVFLTVFTGIVHENIETQAKEINKQIVLNFESYINSIIETADYIQFGSVNLDAETDAATIDSLFRMNTEIKKDMVSIFLFDTAGRKIAGPTLEFATGGSVADKDWFQTALRIPEIYNFSTEQGSSVAENRSEQVITVSRSIRFKRAGREESGVLLLELNYDMITDLARKTNLGEYGHLMILDDQGRLLYTSETGEPRMTLLSAKEASSIFLGSRRVTLWNTDMFINVNTLIQTRWLIATVSNINGIRNAVKRLALIIVLIYSVSIAICATVAAVISLQVSRPVSQLKTAMLKVEEGDFSRQASVSGQTEIVSLAHSFNAMTGKIRELMARLVSQQREKRKMELQVLQNQINPHFLYNTLDSIVWLAEHDRNKDVITTVVALAHFFRIGISKGETFIPVGNEISHVRNYLTIQSIRYVNKFTYDIQVDSRLLGYRVMKLVLQPIVENAIYHGIGDEDDGKIKITGTIENGYMVFRVWNSGYGISEEKIREMYETMRGNPEKPSVGIRNVYQRLKLYYGDEAEVIITSIQDESTTVSLRIPLEPKEERDE
ncbi:MAG TPA: sensor histidine kinase [Treponemataceae bacterium]|nr:sensor histidine kinase [Treponemataceae bacterium]HPX47330.1 sensor histidine kinase [Treponemataceae bacterium]